MWRSYHVTKFVWRSYCGEVTMWRSYWQPATGTCISLISQLETKEGTHRFLNYQYLSCISYLTAVVYLLEHTLSDQSHYTLRTRVDYSLSLGLHSCACQKLCHMVTSPHELRHMVTSPHFEKVRALGEMWGSVAGDRWREVCCVWGEWGEILWKVWGEMSRSLGGSVVGGVLGWKGRWEDRGEVCE